MSTDRAIREQLDRESMREWQEREADTPTILLRDSGPFHTTMHSLRQAFGRACELRLDGAAVAYVSVS